jgi:hypothetical protein
VRDRLRRRRRSGRSIPSYPPRRILEEYPVIARALGVATPPTPPTPPCPTAKRGRCRWEGARGGPRLESSPRGMKSVRLGGGGLGASWVGSGERCGEGRAWVAGVASAGWGSVAANGGADRGWRMRGWWAASRAGWGRARGAGVVVAARGWSRRGDWWVPGGLPCPGPFGRC